RAQGRSRRAQAPFCGENGAHAEAQGTVALAQASGGERKVMLSSRIPSDRVSQGMFAVAQGRSRSAQASRAQKSLRPALAMPSRPLFTLAEGRRVSRRP